MHKMDLPYGRIYLTDNLRSYDPYDIWKTGIGLKVKNIFNNSRLLGAIPALILTLIDQLVNNKLRWGYKKQEYPIVRALAAQILLNKFEFSDDKTFLTVAEKHLEWLEKNISKGYSGACWGLGFKWPAGRNIIYDANSPHATHTPYALEAFHRYTQLSGNDRFIGLIRSCYEFYEKDLCVMYEDDKMMAVSYGPFKDRIATNAVSYVMYSYAIFLSYFPENRIYIADKIQKLFNFIVQKQHGNGSWLYTPDDANSFIDCFHSCFIIKNLVKANKKCRLEGVEQVIEKGYEYIYRNFLDEPTGLYKRFTVKNKFSLTKFDLYDNAEMMNVMNLLGDKERLHNLTMAVDKYFIRNNEIYSIIDIFGIKRNRQMLRWAVMPYLYTISTLH